MKNNYLGFHTLTRGVQWDWSVDADAYRLNLQQLFSGSAEGKEDGLESLRERYKHFKESYVTYMRFEPEEANPSKCIFSSKYTTT